MARRRTNNARGVIIYIAMVVVSIVSIATHKNADTMEPIHYPVRRIFDVITLPISGSISIIHSAFGYVHDFFLYRSQKTEFESKSMYAIFLDVQNAELAQELDALKSKLSLQESSRSQYIFSRVQYELENGVIHALILDKGSRDGITVNDLIVSENGNAIGRIYEVQASHAYVMLLNDARSRTPAVTDSGIFGLLYGDGVEAVFTPINDFDNANLEEGTKIFTSDANNVLEGGILLGTINKQNLRLYHNYTGYQNYIAVLSK